MRFYRRDLTKHEFNSLLQFREKSAIKRANKRSLAF